MENGLSASDVALMNRDNGWRVAPSCGYLRCLS